jgi:fermentation-respiration switch protein FrsA (DUF1100 family)
MLLYARIILYTKWKAFLKVDRYMTVRGMFLLLALILLILAGILFYPQLENSLVFYPDEGFDDSPSNWNLPYRDVLLRTKDGEKLHCWFFPLSGESPTVLFFHGNAGNISHRIENVQRLVERGISVFLLGYRGYGKSTGRPSEKGIYLDGLAAYDYLAETERISPDRIAIFGRSLGGAVAIEVALQRGVKCIVIESTFTSLRDMSKTIFPWSLFSPFVPNHYDSGTKIAALSVPKLIVHGKNDEIVPFWMGEKLFALAKEKKKFLAIEGAGHNNTYIIGGSVYLNELANFISASHHS